MDDKIKRIAKLWKRGIITTDEAWKGIVNIYAKEGFPCSLGIAEQVLEYFVTLVQAKLKNLVEGQTTKKVCSFIVCIICT